MTDASEHDDRTALTTSAEVAHLVGREVPDVALAATAGSRDISLRALCRGVDRLVIYAYPAIGAPERAPITEDWMSIPGAFGCTAESCSFRDANAGIRELGAAVCGLSTQPSAEQHEAAQRLSLNFPLLSDHDNELAEELRLPTWRAGGGRLLKRFTIVTHGTVIGHVFAPVTDPATHVGDVVAWLRDNSVQRRLLADCSRGQNEAAVSHTAYRTSPPPHRSGHWTERNSRCSSVSPRICQVGS